MALNTEFPTWMAQQNRDDTAAGIAIGRNLLEGFRLQQEKARYESEAPIRAAQLEAYKAQTQGNVNRAAAEAFAFKQQMAGQGKMADALKFSSQMAMSGGYTNPDNRILFYDFLAKNPELASTPWAEQQNKMFDTADDFERKKSELQSIYQRNIDVANIRADAAEKVSGLRAESAEKLAEQRAQDRIDLERTKSEERIKVATEAAKSIEQLMSENPGMTREQAIGVKAAGPAGYKFVGPQNFVDNTKALLSGIGYEMTPTDEREAFVLYQGNQGRRAPEKTASNVVSGAQSISLLGKVFSTIEKFEERNGKGSFGKFVGPFDNPVFNAKNAAIPPERLAKENATARAVMKDIAYVIQEFRRGNFGTALTENEIEQFKRIVGDPKYADYVNGVRTFRDNLDKGVRFMTEAYKFSPNIPFPIRQEYFFKPRSGSSQGTTLPSTSGKVFEFIVNPDGTVTEKK